MELCTCGITCTEIPQFLNRCSYDADPYIGICYGLILSLARNSTTFAIYWIGALLLFLWRCFTNYSIWAKQKWEMTIHLQLDKFFLLSGSVLRFLSS